MIINMNGAKAPETPSPVMQEKTVTPETLPTVIGPDAGYDGLTQVTVNPDPQLKAENIRSGKTIFGVTGAFGGNDTTLVLTDIKAYDRKNVIMYSHINNGNQISCTVRVTSAELLATQGYQHVDEVNYTRSSFDYDNVSYTYGYFKVEDKYKECYGKVTMDVTIPETRIYADVRAEYATPLVTEAIQHRYLRSVALYDENNAFIASCVLSKMPEQSLVFYEHTYQNVSNVDVEYQTTIPEVTYSGLEFIVISTKFNPEKALSTTIGKIGDTSSVIYKVVK